MTLPGFEDVRSDINTALSYLAGGGPPRPQGIGSVGVYYSSATTPSALFLGLNGNPLGCNTPPRARMRWVASSTALRTGAGTAGCENFLVCHRENVPAVSPARLLVSRSDALVETRL